MRDVIGEYRRWRAEGTEAGRAVVVRVLGSAPRQEGSTLLVADDGRIAGSISAGCVEPEAIEAVRAARRSGHRAVVRYGISDEQARGVGLGCGGTIDVLIEPRVNPDVAEAAGGPGGVAVVTPLPGEGTAEDRGAARHVVVRADGSRSGSLGDPAHDGELVELAVRRITEGGSRTVELGAGRVFVEVFVAPPRLVIVGAGQVAVHLAAIARALDYHVVIVDARGTFATPERFPDANEILIGWADEVADRAGIDDQASVAVLTHEPRFDDPAIAIALHRGARYVGAIGSRRTHSERLARLRRAGLGDKQLARLRSPIGLDLGGRTPQEIALAIMAEVVAERHGGSGTPLSLRGGTAKAP